MKPGTLVRDVRTGQVGVVQEKNLPVMGLMQVVVVKFSDDQSYAYAGSNISHLVQIKR